MPTTASGTFSGFSPAALRFLRDLKKNNERAWFRTRKDFYERELLAPLQALTADIARALRKAKIPIDVDPSRVAFRIYRDVRFSPDKSPYKTNLGTYLPHNGMREASGGLYVHVAPKASFIVVGFYQLDRPLLQRWRESMANEPERFQGVLRGLAKTDVSLSDQEDALKRMPRGFESHTDSPIARYFRMSSFTVNDGLSDDDVMDGSLIDRSVALAKAAKPLLQFGWSL
jgi:uncharacterized protein (TIGR02453 family)